MKKLAVLSLSLLSLTVNVWSSSTAEYTSAYPISSSNVTTPYEYSSPYTPERSQYKSTLNESSGLYNLANSQEADTEMKKMQSETSSVDSSSTNKARLTLSDRDSKTTLVQESERTRLRKIIDSITPGGEKTKAVGRAIARPFKAIGQSVQDSYGTLKKIYSPHIPKTAELMTHPEKPVVYNINDSKILDVKDGRTKIEKAKIIVTKGVLGAAAPFYAAGHAIKRGAGNAGKAIGNGAISANNLLRAKALAAKNAAATAGKVIRDKAGAAGKAIKDKATSLKNKFWKKQQTVV
jgi:hypothetical protein